MSKAYVLMSCDLGSEKTIISTLNAIDGVSEAHGVFGLYDIVAKIESDDDLGIKKIITGVLRKIPKIHSTMTLTRSESEELFKSNVESPNTISGQNTSQAYIVIHTEKGSEFEVLRNLNHIPEVTEADVVFGHYDVLCKVKTNEYKKLEKIITKSIRAIPHIKTSMTLVVISEQD